LFDETNKLKNKTRSTHFRPINYLGPNILVTESGFRVVL